MGRIKRTQKMKLITGILLLALGMSACSRDGGASSEKDSVEVTQYYDAEDGSYDGNAFEGLSPGEERNSEDDRIVVTMWNGSRTATGVMGYMVAGFNRDNDKYYVDMKQFPGDEVFTAQDRLKMDLAAGKGPDVMSIDIIPEAPMLLDKGCFLDLSELMEKSNMRDEMFFPAYKSLVSGDKIYGVCPSMEALGLTVKKEVIGSEEVPDLDTLLDKLLYYPENAIFLNDGQTGAFMMEYFLCGSDTLWGMIDWDNGCCDFSGKLFSKILDVCKRYADVEKKGYDPIMRWKLMYVGIYPGEDAFQKEDWVTIDFYFDDGNYPRYNYSFDTLLINANTDNVEGAWAFLSYAMSKKGQNYCENPTQKQVFDEMNQEMLDGLEAGRVKMFVDLTEESLEEMKNIFDTAKYPPSRTATIRKMIAEEAEAFFAGDKSKEDVIDVIQKRVNLYLQENK